MRAIHFSEAAHAFSGYATRHPFYCAVEATVGLALIALVSGLLLSATEPSHVAPPGAEASAEQQTDSPEWLWSKRVVRGGHLYPVSP